MPGIRFARTVQAEGSLGILRLAAAGSTRPLRALLQACKRRSHVAPTLRRPQQRRPAATVQRRRPARQLVRQPAPQLVRQPVLRRVRQPVLRRQRPLVRRPSACWNASETSGRNDPISQITPAVLCTTATPARPESRQASLAWATSRPREAAAHRPPARQPPPVRERIL